MFLYPFAWLLAASLKPRGEVFDNRLIPETFMPQNYVEVWEKLPLLAWVGNSLLIAVLSAVLITLSSSCRLRLRVLPVPAARGCCSAWCWPR